MLLIVLFGLVTGGLALVPHYASNHINAKPQIDPSPITVFSSFSWSNCGSSSIPASFSNFSILPDPLVIPGDLTLALTGKTSVDAISPLPAQMTLKRKVWFAWITIPCIENIGTCSYDDFCTLLQTIFPPAQGCPSVFTQHNIPCHCPIKTGTYVLPSSIINIPTDPLPAALTNGQYELKLNIQTKDKQPLFCIDVKFTLKKSSFNLLSPFWRPPFH